MSANIDPRPGAANDAMFTAALTPLPLAATSVI